jgi:hypothetical protein
MWGLEERTKKMHLRASKGVDCVDKTASEMAYWRRQYLEAYEAACNPLTGYAITGRHDFINKRLERMGAALTALRSIGGDEEARRAMLECEQQVDGARGHTASAASEDGVRLRPRAGAGTGGEPTEPV